jgi:hypothetical protein
MKDLCRDLDGEADVAIRSCRAPGTRFAFSLRYDYRFSEQLQFVARDRA